MLPRSSLIYHTNLKSLHLSPSSKLAAFYPPPPARPIFGGFPLSHENPLVTIQKNEKRERDSVADGDCLNGSAASAVLYRLTSP
ncbi:hypothetical protein HanIR_Chr17g0891641 [Helianthus annuus]|nr:hypothetical protein HanIR_Chr17g0891641 [Helianthus annuus]